MSEPLTCRLDSPVGPIAVELHEGRIRSLRMGAPSRKESRAARGKTPPLLRRLQRDLDRYFRGAPVAWERYPLAPEGTPFRRKVWRALLKIQHGEVKSYRQIARMAGAPKGFRAVGQACGANPIPILIPCHRVVATDGHLGGFSAGLWRKRILLKCERLDSKPATS